MRETSRSGESGKIMKSFVCPRQVVNDCIVDIMIEIGYKSSRRCQFLASLLCQLVVLFFFCDNVASSFTCPIIHHHQSRSTSSVLLANAAAKIPTSPTDRDNAAIASIRTAISKPRVPSLPLIECEFPSLASLNKLGDGSLRSSLEAEEANIAFVVKLVRGISSPIPLLGPRIAVVISSSAAVSMTEKIRKRVGGFASVYSLKMGGGIPNEDGGGVKKKGSVCYIFITPSSKSDYRTAIDQAELGYPTILLNGKFKDTKTIPGSATMAYFNKPLTYNSAVAGYLIRSYPGPWTVLDAQTKAALGSFTDEEILVEGTNTPDLRESGRMVRKSVDNRAIEARSVARK